MLGVIADPSEEYAVREFFELFKTPWEFYRRGAEYDVVLAAGDFKLDQVSAKLVLIYSGGRTEFDTDHHIEIHSRADGEAISFAGTSIPVYGSSLRFGLQDTEPKPYVIRLGEPRYARVGYDLFEEVQTLLLAGQPSRNATIPTLELHIALLRRLIVGCGLPIVEVPPVPAGHRFIACLTHDLDHASIRRHKFDATMLGFLYRATWGSAANALRGRLPAKKLLKNWVAVAKLPLVYMGVVDDFWYQFDGYLALEKGRPSTFFVIPFAGRPGRLRSGTAPSLRGAGYDVSHVAQKLRMLQKAGCEIGLHGIDAWTDRNLGREEARRISEACESTTAGVRMHWLYRDDESPAVLEESGFSYDSTVGYNETVGYRAGTTQVFKPLKAKRLLELPLHVMDTALFYPDYLNLSDEEAWDFLTPLFDNAREGGGVFTVNWHDRSIAPERLWGDFYGRMIDELTARGALFCTAARAVSWFQKRRSVVFEKTCTDGTFSAKVSSTHDDGLPGLRLRVHQSTSFPTSAEVESFQTIYTETIFEDCTKFRLAN